MSSSLNSILNVARSAILANQTGVRVASQNIANVQSEGYSRRTVQFVASRPDISSGGRFGTGVRIHGVTRVRDELLDATFRRESSKASGSLERQDVLGRVEQVFGEPSEEGLAASLDAFWASWSDLANRPSNATARRTVQQRGEQVAATLRSFDARLQEVRQHSTFRLQEAVQNVNGMAEQIARLNREIVTSEVGGQEAHELRDQRDQLLDSLSEITRVQVVDRGRGSIAVMVENATLVDGANFKTMSVDGNPPSVTVQGLPLTSQPDGGKLGALLSTLSRDIPDAQARLNGVATALVAQVNALHQSGYTTDGQEGGAFFLEGATTAATISLDGGIADDPSGIVASDSATESTNNRIALAMAALQGRPSDNRTAERYPRWTAARAALNNESIGEYYQDLVTEVGLKVSSAQHSAQVFGTVVAQAATRRQSVSGVSTDEEMVKLIHFQQAYTAATKVVTTVDEMLQAVLNMV